MKESLIKLWELVRDKRVESVGTLKVQLEDSKVGFLVLGVAKTIRDAKTNVRIEGEYETSDDGQCVVQFEGPIADSLPVRDFLVDQFRDAKSQSVEIELEFEFESGLSMAGTAPETVTGRLSRYVNCEAFVKAVPWKDQ